MKMQGAGIALVKKSARRVETVREVREGSTGRLVSMLPRVWAVAERVEAPISKCARPHPSEQMRLGGDPGPHPSEQLRLGGDPGSGAPAPAPGVVVTGDFLTERYVDDGDRSRRPRVVPVPEMAFYRKYTEAMLRRYLRMSLQAGRVPSLLGRELFRGNVTHYKAQNFEDVVIFCMDVERCLAKLQPMERDLLRRIAVQEYTQGEASLLLGLSLRGCVQRYYQSVDRLTRLLLEARMLEPLKSCQGGGPVSAAASA